MGQNIARLIINLIIKVSSRLEAHGLENLQDHSSFIIAANHIGRLDVILIYYFTRRKDVVVMVAEKYQKNPLLRWFARQLNAIFVDRYNADFAVLREVLKRLKNGGVLVLAPEGTRSPTAQLQKAWDGAGYLAAKAGVPIVPVGLAGSEDARFFGNLRRLRRTNVVIRAGKPFWLQPIQGKDRDGMLEQYTDEIMCQIAALLPPEYRGIYANHPRLKELLSQKASACSQDEDSTDFE